MANGTVTGGVYEIVIGTTDPESLVKYWQQFGFFVGEEGELSAEYALKLYGVDSKLKSIRLHHQDADHGLIRIFIWDKPVNNGLELSRMKVFGNRWGAILTRNLIKVENHIEEAIAQNMPIYYIPPQRIEVYEVKERPKPFLEKYPSVRELILIQPYARQVIFQRCDYNIPLYGTIDELSFFQTSQIVHVGIVIPDKNEYLDFYDNVLDLLRSSHQEPGATTYEKRAVRPIFEITQHESYADSTFDDPRSSKDDLQLIRSGRLKVVRFSDGCHLEDKLSHSRPGSLGYSLYTLRTHTIELSHKRVCDSLATDVTDIYSNEFGEQSFSFVAPDGYYWTILESKVFTDQQT